MRLVLAWFAASAALAMGGEVRAHANGASYLRIDATDERGRLIAEWDIPAADLQLPLDLDRNGDGVTTAGEFRARESAIARFAVDRLEIRRDGRDCRLAIAALEAA
ncbi:MAG: hypothetical protein L0271_27600, partial [Gemmatimonadetes bacterium]|nr:hypothetical protein [Gemmatimonadota bacterium]